VLQIIIHRNLRHMSLSQALIASTFPVYHPSHPCSPLARILIEILKQNRPSGKNLYEGAKIFYGDEMTKALARRFPADNREKCITAPGPGMV
jgi:hypothetical protein